MGKFKRVFNEISAGRKLTHLHLALQVHTTNKIGAWPIQGIILSWPRVSFSFCQVIALADAAEDNRECLIQACARLRSASHLLILLLSLWRGLNSEQAAILEATLLPLLQDTPQLVSNRLD